MDNLRGAALMTLSMLGFAIEDMFIKMIAGALPVGQIISILGVGGAVIFGILTRVQSQPLFPRAILSAPVLIRNLGEVVGTLGFVTAIALTPLSSASAILQATPLVVTLGAALFLQEQVGWRRWSAILVGFCGVLLIIRPGMQDFDYKSLFAVQGVIGLALRDLATRRVPAETSSMQLSFLAFLILVPTGVIVLWLNGQTASMPDGTQALLLAGCVTMGVVSYYAIVAAMRMGDVSFVTPFRYSRILFALVVGVLVFDERPDALLLLGAAIIVGSGIFTLWRERKIRN